MLVMLVVIVTRGWFIPAATHKRELAAAETHAAQAYADRDAQVEQIRAEMDTRMANFRSDHAIRMDQVREDHQKQLTALREDHQKQLAALVAVNVGQINQFDSVLASKQRDIDDWRGAYHIGSENWKISEDRMDEVLETVRLVHSVVRAALRGSDPQ